MFFRKLIIQREIGDLEPCFLKSCNTVTNISKKSDDLKTLQPDIYWPVKGDQMWKLKNVSVFKNLETDFANHHCFSLYFIPHFFKWGTQQAAHDVPPSWSDGVLDSLTSWVMNTSPLWNHSSLLSILHPCCLWTLYIFVCGLYFVLYCAMIPVIDFSFYLLFYLFCFFDHHFLHLYMCRLQSCNGA